MSTVKIHSQRSSSNTAHDVNLASSLEPSAGSSADIDLGDLQAEGIIPRSPSPVPLENRDPETLNREELLELNRLRARDADRAKVKLEGIKREGVKREGQKRARSPALDSDGDPDEVTIIDEGPSRKRTRASTDSAIEIVDLTED